MQGMLGWSAAIATLWATASLSRGADGNQGPRAASAQSSGLTALQIQSQVDLDTALAHLDDYVTQFSGLDADDKEGRDKLDGLLAKADELADRHRSDPTFAVPDAWSIHATVLVLRAADRKVDSKDAAATLAVLQVLIEKGCVPFAADKRKAMAKLNAIDGVRPSLDYWIANTRKLQEWVKLAEAGNADYVVHLSEAIQDGFVVVASEPRALIWMGRLDAKTLLRTAEVFRKDPLRNEVARLALKALAQKNDVRGDIELAAMDLGEAKTASEASAARVKLMALNDRVRDTKDLPEGTQERYTALCKQAASRYDELKKVEAAAKKIEAPSATAPKP